jgi:selenocysteine lyase/cysteine desulfurase
VYFSPHKLVGGPGAPGVLVVKRRLLNIAKVPTQPGGGTVFFVTDKYAATRLKLDSTLNWFAMSLRTYSHIHVVRMSSDLQITLPK